MRHPEDSMNDAGSSPTGSVAGGPKGSGRAPIVRMQWAGIQRGTASCTPGKRGHLEVSGRSSAPRERLAVLLRALRLLVSVVRLDSCSTFHVKRREVSLHVIDSG